MNEVYMKSKIFGLVLIVIGCASGFYGVLNATGNKSTNPGNKAKPNCPKCKTSVKRDKKNTNKTKLSSNNNTMQPDKNKLLKTGDSTSVKVKSNMGTDATPVMKATMVADASSIKTPDDSMVMDSMKKSVSDSSLTFVFKVKSKYISKETKVLLTAMARDYSDYKFKLYIRAGETGTKKKNKRLGGSRARAIRKILIAAGIKKKHVHFRVKAAKDAPDGDLSKYKSTTWRKALIKAIPRKK
jgi:outer membrane protein OmpA-like peptidoglycan-associated protein